MTSTALRDLLIRVETEARARGWAQMGHEARRSRMLLAERGGGTVIHLDFHLQARRAAMGLCESHETDPAAV